MNTLKNLADGVLGSIQAADVNKALSAEQTQRLLQLTIEEVAHSLALAGELESEKEQQAVKEALSQPVARPDAILMDLPGLLHPLRISGTLPYYFCKALGCFFAAKVQQGPANEVAVDVANNGVRQAIAAWCGITTQVELVDLIARQFDAALKGSIAEDERRIHIIKEAYRLGYHYEKVYRGCAQCTLAALYDITGKKDELLFRASNSLAAGIGLFGDGSCGGYTGGVLMMGTYAGRRMEHFDGDKEEKDQNALLVQKLHDRFIATYGTVTCHDIHRKIFGRSFYIRRPDEKEGFELAGAHKADKCTAVVATASQWTAEILLDEGYITL